jgi:hypothetical protein
MCYSSHAHLTAQATLPRIRALVRDLEFYGCTVHVHYGARRIDIDVPERLERWIVLGGFARVLGRYDDILCWHPNFSNQDETPCQTLERKLPSRAAHHL